MSDERSQPDRLAIPSSSMSDEEDRRNQQYDREARNQDLSDADDKAREADEYPRAGAARPR